MADSWCSASTLGIFGLGAGEILVIAVVVILLFGSTKIPSLARSLGKGISEFKKGIQEGGQDETASKPTAEAGKSEPPKPA